ncbi:MAG TPA: hypothetical protein VHC49_16125, partial [Mycobacteriales bacterium]|nr:hypothetical protein [Mycobacteriales bacterium]
MAATLVQATRRQLIKVHRIRTNRPAGADALALAVLLGLPILSYCLPAIFGGVVQPGDNYDQNYPLRILVGRMLQDGTWPLLDPYNWSGSPLLGGWNAGAAYPFTALFAILPNAAAWVLNQLIIYWTAGLGLYAYLRHKRLAPVAALLGAIAFT